MLGEWRTHMAYRDFVLLKLGSPHSGLTADHEHLDIVKKLFMLDLDPLKDILAGRYPRIGRAAVSQPEIMRMLILMSHLKLPVNKLIPCLKSNYILRSAVGLLKREIPSIASVYNFIYRITGHDLKPAIKKTTRKPAYKLKSGEKLPPKHPNITARLRDKLLVGRRFNDRLADSINKILKLVIKQSYANGLIESSINVSGDGTCMRTGASHYGKKVCGCKSLGLYNCDCPRKFSDPRASWGWDSHNNQCFYGYTGYFLSTYDKTHKIDLPLYIRVVDAKRHDSVSALVAISEFYDLYPQLRINTFISDSASDNQPTYDLLDEWHINAVIALGKTNNQNYKYPVPGNFDLGTPVCPAGHKMIQNGDCGGRRTRTKWRCPRVLGKADYSEACKSCSDSSYGRTFYTKPEWDLRMFPRIPRGSALWKSNMKERTAAERVNNRILNDYGVGHARRRGKNRIAFFTLLAAINIHLDAQLKVQTVEYDARRKQKNGIAEV